jgi:2-octaprenyl-6-methoxyphenol hydroxylase
VVIGAGPVGAIAALALAARGIGVRLLEARGRAEGKADRRAIALSWGSRLALDRVGIWPRIAQADPIERVSVSERGAFGSIEFTTADLGTPALGYVVDYGDLARACADSLDAAGVDVAYHTAVSALSLSSSQEQPGGVLLDLAPHGQVAHRFGARCVVLADGAEGIEAEATLVRHERAYRQVALVGEVACDHFMRGRAFERFTGSGPLALLPRADHYACVWVVEPAYARMLLDGGASALAQGLQRAAGPGFGAMRWLTAPREVPLALRRTRAPADVRVVPIGNASQMLHPVAGQGFNLGVRDALALAAAWPVAGAGEPVGSPGADAQGDMALRTALGRFRRARRADRTLTVGITDVIARVTAVDHPVAAAVRGLGLAAIDVLPSARRRALETLVFGVA